MSIPKQTATFLDTEALTPHLDNIRENLGQLNELIASIQEHGIMQPLVVTEHPTKRGSYLVLAGHRRRAAAMKLGLPKVPCIIRHGQGEDTDRHIALMFVENTHRKQLSAVEKARAIGHLLGDGQRTKTEVAKMIGLSPSMVGTYANLLRLDSQSLAAVEDGLVGVGEAQEAVKHSRARDRQSDGKAARGRPVVIEPSYLNSTHSLAGVVRHACSHTTRPVVGTVGCGQCWELVIRDDERERVEREGLE